MEIGLCARPSTELRMTAARGLGLVLRDGGDGLLRTSFDGDWDDSRTWVYVWWRGMAGIGLRTSFDGAQDDSRTRVRVGVLRYGVEGWWGLAFARVLRRGSG
jgi:hypothetical protein